MFRRADKFTLSNCLAWILFLVHTRFLPAFFAECCLQYFMKRAGKTPVFKLSINVSNDKLSEQRFFSKSMFSTTSCVCVNLGSLRIHQFFLSERWYKLWLKIAITCFSDTRFTRKIISALYIDICISKQAKFINFIATATWSRSSPSFSSSSCRRRQRKRLLLKVPNFENSQLPSFNPAFRELATHKYGPGSTPGPKVKCGLNLLLILALLWGLFFHFCFFSLHKNQVEHF